MSSLWNLVRNENMKIYTRMRTWIMLSILVVLTIAIAAITNYYAPADLKPSIWNMMHDLGNGLTGLITIFTVIIAAEIVAGEFTWGTIKLLLIRPASRTKILLSKYIATVLFSLLLTFVLFIVSFLISGILAGFAAGDPMPIEHTSGLVQDRNTIGYVLGTYGYNYIDLLIIVTFSFMMSSVFRSSSMAIGFSLFLMFTGSTLVFALSRYEWVKFILFANMNLRQYVEGNPLIQGTTLGFSIGMLIAYFIGFHLLAWLVFNKRDVSS